MLGETHGDCATVGWKKRSRGGGEETAAANVSPMHLARQGVGTEEMQYVAKAKSSSRSWCGSGDSPRPRDYSREYSSSESRHRWAIGVAFSFAKSTRKSENSATTSNIDEELKKLHHSVHYGAGHRDGPFPRRRYSRRFARRSSNASPVTCWKRLPVYEAISRLRRPEDLTIDLMLEVIEEQAETRAWTTWTIHAGVLARNMLPLVRKPHYWNCEAAAVSLMAHWMEQSQEAEFLYENIERIMQDFSKKHDVSFFVRRWPCGRGCIADASDEAQFAE